MEWWGWRTRWAVADAVRRRCILLVVVLVLLEVEGSEAGRMVTRKET